MVLAWYNCEWVAKFINLTISLDERKMMMNKKRLLFMLCGMLIIPSAPLNVMAMEKEDIKIEAVQTVTGLNTALEDNNAGENDGELSRIVAVKEKSSSKAKKKKKNKRNKKNNKNNKKKNTKKKNSGKKMGKKRKDKKTDKYKKNNKNIKNKKDKKKDMDKKKDIDIKEEDVNKLPETDKYRPELKEKEKENQNNNQNNGGGEIIPPGGGQAETLSRDYVVFCDYTDKKGKLRFKAGNSIDLPEKGYIGLKANGENTGKETEIDWSGSSLQNIKNGIKGSYNLTVVPKENIIIGGKDYGKVKFVVDIIVE